MAWPNEQAKVSAQASRIALSLQLASYHLHALFKAWVVYRSCFQNFSSHQILEHIYEALDIDENKN